MAPVGIEAVGAIAVLRVQPVVGGGQHALHRAAHAPGVGRAVVVLQQRMHSGCTGNVTDIAAADAVGQRQGHALAGQGRAFGDADTMEVLVDFLVALVRMLADAHAQGVAHGLIRPVCAWGLCGYA